ncbi:alkaline phosphatase [Spirochaetota bacterium]
MNKFNFIKKLFSLLAVILVFLFAGCKDNSALEKRNIILFIGDGMGSEQIRAARYYNFDEGNYFGFEKFTYQGQMITESANSEITDSAASATAMATGIKVNNGVISMKLPGDGTNLETILEYYNNKGKYSGIITTAHVTHATPAAFGAHETSRSNYSDIALDYLSSRPNVIMGGGGYGIIDQNFTDVGYTVISDKTGFLAINNDSDSFLACLFGTDNLPYIYDDNTTYPSLSQMVSVGINLLNRNEEGFFLMVEGGRIDHAGHDNNITRLIFETIEFAKAVDVAHDWASDRKDTLIIVTADHETGGLEVITNNGKGSIPEVLWSTTGHTGTNVPVFAIGIGANKISGIIDNTDIYNVIK